MREAVRFGSAPFVDINQALLLRSGHGLTRIGTPMRILIIAVLCLGSLASSAALVQASESVTVLLPERFRVDESIASELFEHLGSAVSEHPSYTLADLPAQTLPDLAQAIGCTDSRSECLALIGEILETDYLLYGEVGGSSDAFLVELTLWSVADGAESYRFTKAIEGELEAFQQMMPTLARGVVFGPVGQLRVVFSPAEAEFEFDTQPVGGTSPIMMTGVELGPHVILVTHPEYFEHREVVVVDVAASTVTIEMVPFVEEIEQTSGLLWTWLSLGSGVLLTGTGVAFALLSQGNQDDYDRSAQAVRLDMAHLDSLQDEGERNALLANVFLGVGGAALVASVILFFVEGDSDDLADAPDEGLSVGFSGNAVTLDFSF